MDVLRTNADVNLERLRRAQAVAQVGSWELDLSTRSMWGSEEAFRIYGLPVTPDQIMSLRDVQAVPLPVYRPLLDRALADLIAGRGPYDVEFEIRRRSDGALRVVHSLAELDQRPGAPGPVVVGTLQDITARKAVEDALRTSEARFRMILEHAADAIVIATGSEIVEANQRATELTGLSRDELIGRRPSTLLAEADLARLPLQYERLDRGEAVIAERSVVRPDGSLVPVEMHTARVPDGTYHTILRDLTERRRLESQLQLRQRMDAIGTLAGGIAHDFSNILVAILGYAELLARETPELSEPGREAARHLLTAAQRGTDLARRLRSLTRPDGPEHVVFDLRTTASDVCDMLAETTDRRIRKLLEIAPGTYYVRGSESDVYHALVNLGLNAVQAIEEKGVRDGDEVRFQAEQCEVGSGDPRGLAPGRYIALSVRDTGAGMSPEVRAQAFDPLFSTKTRGTRRGQGLGLTMVYNIVVEQHHGGIAVETVPGGGSTFSLYLPAGQKEMAEPAPAPPPGTAAKTGTVLVVEDEEQIAGLARRVLGQMGCRVLEAADGVAAIERFAAHADEIDLVLLDQNLPRLSGDEVLVRIRQLRPDIKVILSSGNAAAPVPDDCPGCAVLSKPYSLADLRAAVRSALGPPAGAI